MKHQITVLIDDETRVIQAEDGVMLRDALLAADISPYAPLTQRLNCGGRGLCATCGVWIEGEDDPPTPQHWHDRVGDRFGYPRLSCQIRVERPMTVRILTDKWIWGGRKPSA